MSGNLPLVLLTVTGTIGAVDVLYYHLYRFRLYGRPESVAEEATHLVRHVVFLALLALLATGVPSAGAERAVVALIVVDLANSAADVLLERRSRATLGGLPSLEYLVHVLSSLGTGAAIAAYALAERPLAVPTGMFRLQVAGMLLIGVGLLAVEAVLFARAIRHRATTGRVGVAVAG